VGTLTGSYKLDADSLDSEWRAFKDRDSHSARDALILHYQPLVVMVANRVAAKLPAHVDKEDLASYGYIGLIDAMEKFDLARGLKFETYAVTRINGQIIDELRKLDWIPRSVHSQVKEVQLATTELETKLQRPATHAEIAEHAGLTTEQFNAARSERTFVNVMALDALLDNAVGDETMSLMTQLSDRTQSPDQDIEVEAIKDLVAGAMGYLAERESIVLALYYFEGLTLSDIGKLLGVTESRVCQMHTRAMVSVRGKLAAV
jgi:RNA polymerase sigma factor for flagellar operon FliA